jgi:hypothetical protein
VSGDGSAAGAALGVGKACAEATGSGFGAGDGGKATRLVTPFPSASTVTPRCLITTMTVRAMITTNANRQGAVNLELIRWPGEPAVLLDLGRGWGCLLTLWSQYLRAHRIVSVRSAELQSMIYHKIS